MKVYNTIEEFIEERTYFETPVYMTSGGFDPMHVGHLRCILATVAMADADGGYVVIVVNGDGFLHRKKGFAFMPEQERAEIIAGLRGVDAVVIWDDGGQTVTGAIEKLKPDYFTKGGDRTSAKNVPEFDMCEQVGCKVLFNIGGGKIQSSSTLVQKFSQSTGTNHIPKTNNAKPASSDSK
jgi:D-beta-D-heptose 7-phosphate kinase/D-beta-D-heptose 1-phosphate adenosyltransferase